MFGELEVNTLSRRCPDRAKHANRTSMACLKNSKKKLALPTDAACVGEDVIHLAYQVFSTDHIPLLTIYVEHDPVSMFLHVGIFICTACSQGW